MSYLIPYLGGKTRLAKTIIARMPAHTCYVEVFAGGAAVFFSKPPSETEVLNDRDGDLVNMYRILKYHPEFGGSMETPLWCAGRELGFPRPDSAL